MKRDLVVWACVAWALTYCSFESVLAQEATKPHLRKHLLLNDGRVMLVNTFKAWTGSINGLVFYQPRGDAKYIELMLQKNVDGDSLLDSNFDSPGRLLLRIPLERLDSVRFLDNGNSEVTLIDGQLLRGTLRGSDWSGQSKSEAGLDQKLSFEESEVKAVRFDRSDPRQEKAVITTTEGEEFSVTDCYRDIAEMSFSRAQNTSSELGVKTSSRATTEVPTNDIETIEFIAEGKVKITLKNDHEVAGELTTGLYLTGDLLYGDNQELDFELLLYRSGFPILREMRHAEAGSLKPKPDTKLTWALPKAEDTSTKVGAAEGYPSATEAAAAAKKAAPARKKPSVSAERVAASRLRLAKSLIDKGRADTAKKFLEEIVSNYGKTKVATEAQELLDGIK